MEEKKKKKANRYCHANQREKIISPVTTLEPCNFTGSLGWSLQEHTFIHGEFICLARRKLQVPKLSGETLYCELTLEFRPCHCILLSKYKACVKIPSRRSMYPTEQGHFFKPKLTTVQTIFRRNIKSHWYHTAVEKCKDENKSLITFCVCKKKEYQA